MIEVTDYLPPGSKRTGNYWGAVLLVDDQRTLDEAHAIARTFEVGQLLLDEFRWQHVVLDFDLGGGEKQTGLALLEHVLRLPEAQRPATFEIAGRALLTEGKRRMIDKLEAHGYEHDSRYGWWALD